MNNIKTLQEFPFTLKPVTIGSGVHQGETEIHLQEQFSPAKMEGTTRVAPASVGTRNNAEMALVLFQKNPSIAETDVLCGPCIVRTTEGLQVGSLSGHHGTPDSMCVVISGLKRLAGRTLVMARLAASKAKLSQKYSRLAAKCGSTGRRVVLTDKAISFRTAAHNQWLKAFQTLARVTTAATTKPSTN
ncbi:MAG: hypothetical protein WCO56_07140 [Verrucomicrobiota bacterium]